MSVIPSSEQTEAAVAMPFPVLLRVPRLLPEREYPPLVLPPLERTSHRGMIVAAVVIVLAVGVVIGWQRWVASRGRSSAQVPTYGRTALPATTQPLPLKVPAPIATRTLPVKAPAPVAMRGQRAEAVSPPLTLPPLRPALPAAPAPLPATPALVRPGPVAVRPTAPVQSVSPGPHPIIVSVEPGD